MEKGGGDFVPPPPSEGGATDRPAGGGGGGSPPVPSPSPARSPPLPSPPQIKTKKEYGEIGGDGGNWGGGGGRKYKNIKIGNNSLGRLETCSNRSERVFDGFKRVNLTGFRRVSTGLDGFQRVLTRTHQECYVDFFFRFDKDTSLFVSFFRFLDTITIFNDKNTHG